MSLSLPLVICAGPVDAIEITHSLKTDIVNGQVKDQGLFEKAWESEQINFEQKLLNRGDYLTLNVVFNSERSIKVTDKYFYSDLESIKFFIGGSGGTGGGLTHALNYIWVFAGVQGDLVKGAEKIEGTGRLYGNTGNGVISPNADALAQRDIEPTDDNFTFAGISLRLKVPDTISAEWAPNFVRLHVDGDGIEVLNADGTRAPVPGPLPLLGLGVAFSYTRKLRKLIQAGSLPNEKIAKAYSQK